MCRSRIRGCLFCAAGFVVFLFTLHILYCYLATVIPILGGWRGRKGKSSSSGLFSALTKASMGPKPSGCNVSAISIFLPIVGTALPRTRTKCPSIMMLGMIATKLFSSPLRRERKNDLISWSGGTVEKLIVISFLVGQLRCFSLKASSLCRNVVLACSSAKNVGDRRVFFCYLWRLFTPTIIIRLILRPIF